MSPSRESPDCSMDMTFVDHTDRLEDRLYAYETLASLCKGGSGNKKQCRQACKKILPYLLRDLQDTFPIVGLELLGCFIQLFRLGPSELESVIDVIFSKLRNCSNKITCRKAMWCLANVPITVELFQEKINLIIESSLLFVQEHHDVVSNSIVCEAFKALKRVSEFDREYLTSYLEQIFTGSVQYLFHDAERLRELSLAVLQKYAQDISRRGYITKTLLEALRTTYVCKLATFVEQKDPYLPKLWEFIIICISPCLQSNGNLALVNELLRVEELALKSSDLTVRLNAINAWEKLIDVFVSCGRTPSGTRLKLLTGPLKSGVTKTHEIGAAKLRLWWHLITRLRDQAVSRFQLVTLPFLTFFFGSPESQSAGGPLTVFPGLASDATLALISTVSPETVVESGTFSRQFLLISPEIFSSYCGQIRSFCERAIEFLDSDSELVFELWRSFKSQCLIDTPSKAELFHELKLFAKYLTNLAQDRGTRDLLVRVCGEACDILPAADLTEFSGVVMEALSTEQKPEIQELLLTCWDKVASAGTLEHIDSKFISVPLGFVDSKNQGLISSWERLFSVYPHDVQSLEDVLETLDTNPKLQVQEQVSKIISTYLLKQLTEDPSAFLLGFLDNFTSFLLRKFPSGDLLESWRSEVRTLSQSGASWSHRLVSVLELLPEETSSTAADPNIFVGASAVEDKVHGNYGNKRRLSDDSDSDVSVVVEVRPAKRAKNYVEEDWKLGCAVVLVEAISLPALTDPDCAGWQPRSEETVSINRNDPIKSCNDTSVVGFAEKAEGEAILDDNIEKTPVDDTYWIDRALTTKSEETRTGTGASANNLQRIATRETLGEENQSFEATSSRPGATQERKINKTKAYHGKQSLSLPKNRGAQMIEAARRSRGKQPTSPCQTSTIYNSPSSSETRTKHTYSPLASPSAGILKRSGSAENSPSCSALKNRRVSFRCPVISDQIEFSTESEGRRPLGLSRRSLLQSYNQANSKQPAVGQIKLSDSNEEHELGVVSIEATETSSSARTEDSDLQKSTRPARVTERVPASDDISAEPAADTDEPSGTCFADGSANITLPYGTDHDSPELPCVRRQERSARNNVDVSMIVELDEGAGHGEGEKRDEAPVGTTASNLRPPSYSIDQVEGNRSEGKVANSASGTSDAEVACLGVPDIDALEKGLNEQLRSLSAEKVAQILSRFVASHPRPDQVLLNFLTGDTMLHLQVLRDRNVRD